MCVCVCVCVCVAIKTSLSKKSFKVRRQSMELGLNVSLSDNGFENCEGFKSLCVNQIA